MEEFAGQLEIALRLDVASGRDQRPSAGSLEVVDDQRKKAVDRIGAHVAFNCLRHLLYEKLYSPTPEESPLSAVLDELNDVTEEIFPLVQEPEAFNGAPQSSNQQHHRTADTRSHHAHALEHEREAHLVAV